MQLLLIYGYTCMCINILRHIYVPVSSLKLSWYLRQSFLMFPLFAVKFLEQRSLLHWQKSSQHLGLHRERINLLPEVGNLKLPCCNNRGMLEPFLSYQYTVLPFSSM